MPERIYMNRIAGQRRIHVEIDEAEIADLLDDLAPAPDDAFAATKQLVAILRAAADSFAAARRQDAAGGAR